MTPHDFAKLGGMDVAALIVLFLALLAIAIGGLALFAAVLTVMRAALGI